MCNYNRNSRSVAKDKEATSTLYLLPETITPERYKLRLRIDVNKRKVYGHSLVHIYIHNKTSVIELNSVGLTINGAFFKSNNIRGKLVFLNLRIH